jgi:N-acetyl-anhydromuramyl-L-alanine amidase AmpD
MREVAPTLRSTRYGSTVPGSDLARGSSGNYSAGRNARIDRVVIHVTDGPATLAVQTATYFANNAVSKSAHFVVGRDGVVHQMVRIGDKANHAGPANNRSVGIEHVVPHAPHPKTITHAQYAASATLVRWLCGRLNLAVNRTTVIGHSEADPGTGHKTCPQLAWNWSEYQAHLNWSPMIADLAAGRF